MLLPLLVVTAYRIGPAIIFAQSLNGIAEIRVPPSSVAKPDDAGIHVHTNIQITGPVLAVPANKPNSAGSPLPEDATPTWFR